MAAKPIPEGYHTVTPFVIVKGAAQLLDFMREAFGAVELGRVFAEDGSISHAETRVGDSVVMMFDGKKTGPTRRASCVCMLKIATRSTSRR